MRTLTAVAVLASNSLLAQTGAPLPSFEVASVKTVSSAKGTPDGLFAGRRRSGGRLTWTTARAALIAYAYHLPSWRIAGLEPDQNFYVIDATMDATATEDQVRLMLQKLLVDRFQIAVHRESKDLPRYSLVLGKNGPKIKEVNAPEATPPMPDYLKGKPPEAFEGRIFVSREGTGISALTARGVPISQLLDALSETLGAFVLDKTGLTGNYYFGFKFATGDGPSDSDSPSLFAALQEELGLKLEKQKGPVEVLVIDRIAKAPTEN